LLTEAATETDPGCADVFTDATVTGTVEASNVPLNVTETLERVPVEVGAGIPVAAPPQTNWPLLKAQLEIKFAALHPAGVLDGVAVAEEVASTCVVGVVPVVAGAAGSGMAMLVAVEAFGPAFVTTAV
jgi:hypothetical protein